MNIKMTRGDTLAFNVEIEFDENVQDLDTAYFTCKSDFGENAVFIKSLGDGISKLSSIDNKLIYTVRIAPEDTEVIEAGNYYYDMEIGINGDIFTILKGTLKIETDITR